MSDFTRYDFMGVIRAAATRYGAPSEHYVRGPLQCRSWYAACIFSNPRRVEQTDEVMLNLYLVLKVLLFFDQLNFNLHYNFFINPSSAHTYNPTVAYMYSVCLFLQGPCFKPCFSSYRL